MTQSEEGRQREREVWVEASVKSLNAAHSSQRYLLRPFPNLLQTEITVHQPGCPLVQMGFRLFIHRTGRNTLALILPSEIPVRGTCSFPSAVPSLCLGIHSVTAAPLPALTALPDIPGIALTHSAQKVSDWWLALDTVAQSWDTWQYPCGVGLKGT